MFVPCVSREVRDTKKDGITENNVCSEERHFERGKRRVKMVR